MLKFVDYNQQKLLIENRKIINLNFKEKMKINFTKSIAKLFALVLTFTLLFSAFAYAAVPKYAVCKKVVDGDTIELNDGTRVRLIGINSPESGELDYLTAYINLHQKITGKTIRLEYDPINRPNNHLGKYGRLLAYIYFNGVFINEDIVKKGYAKAYLKYPFDEKKQLNFLKAEKYAKKNKLGIWKPFEKDKPQPKSTTNLTKIEKLKLNAEKGDVKAQYQLGREYFNGDNLPLDKEKSFYWYRKAAEQGNADAQSSLALYYTEILMDFNKAVYWYKKAANQGNAEAQSSLGFHYDTGIGIQQNYEKAIYWYRKAANQGNAVAQFSLGHNYAEGKGVPINYEKAIFWYEKAANQENAYAQFYIGRNYAEGKGVPINYEKAVYWYRKAANQGNEYAQFFLGANYFDGKGVPINYEKAVYWFRKAAEQGYADAQCTLGFCYATGKYVPKDIEQAKYWFQKAVAQGHENAQSALNKLQDN